MRHVLPALLAAALACGCPNWQRPACPTPGVYSCLHDSPAYCGAAGELTPVGDEPCGRVPGRACAIDAHGVAYCAPVATDGGAP